MLNDVPFCLVIGMGAGTYWITTFSNFHLKMKRSWSIVEGFGLCTVIQCVLILRQNKVELN